MEQDICTVRVPSGYVVGRWRVGHLLASGGWSSVYRATRVTPGDDAAPREAALKFIPTGTLTSRQLTHLAEMTNREVAVHRHASHPGLIRVLDIVVVDDPADPALDGVTVLAMELAAEPAAAALERAAGAGLAAAPRIIADVCGALAYLHRSGWVHGDLKPSNILLMRDGSARLADFGLAAHIDGTHAYLPPGGTSDYVPPERWAEPVRRQGTAVRQTADVWALGIVACQLLTGCLPFPGVTSRARASAAGAYAAGHAALNLPDALGEPWRGFVTDCLAPDHDVRRRHDVASLHRRALEIISADDDAPRPGHGVGRRAVVAAGSLLAAAGAALALAGAVPTEGRPDALRSTSVGYNRYFRTDAGIPPAYYNLIVEAGTTCPDTKAVTPLLVAAMLRTESNFDPNLSDPAADEYGIARWTPRVLKFYLPAGQRKMIPEPPFTPDVSIPAVGRYLCWMAPKLEEVPGNAQENLAAAYRTSSETVRNAGGIPYDRPEVVRYIGRLRTNLNTYRPAV
jgi:serine/threonine protein kinase